MFRIGSSTSLDWFLSRNRWEEIEFPDQFLRSRAVTEALPNVCRKVGCDSFGFEWGNAFTLAGDLAQTLSQGGAYRKHEAGPRDAFDIAEDFRNWLFDDRFDEVTVLKSFKPWSPWFYDVAWDGTWLILDKRRRTLCVLAITDTD